jgi:opacity protein-like surface antigen
MRRAGEDARGFGPPHLRAREPFREMPIMPDRSGSAAVAALIAALAAAPSAADGFYVEVEPGFSMLADADLTVTADFPFEGGGASGDIESEPTWVVGGSLGYRWRGLRVELHASYRKPGFDEVTLRDPNLPGGGGDIGDDGDLQAFVGLFNVFYGFPLGRFEPFVGGGLGFANLDLEGDYGANILDVDEDSTEFAWSVSGGVAYSLMEHVDVSLGYRYLGMTDPEFATFPYIRVNPDMTTTPFTGSAEIEVVLHEFLVGIRYSF